MAKNSTGRLSKNLHQPLEPVIVTVTATEPATGRVLGSSTVILGWDGDFAVMVKEIR